MVVSRGELERVHNIMCVMTAIYALDDLGGGAGQLANQGVPPKTRIYRRETRKFASAGEFKLASIFIAKKKITSLSSAMSKWLM